MAYIETRKGQRVSKATHTHTHRVTGSHRASRMSQKRYGTINSTHILQLASLAVQWKGRQTGACSESVTHRRALGNVAPDRKGARSHHGANPGAEGSLPGAGGLEGSGEHDGWVLWWRGEERSCDVGRISEVVLEEGDGQRGRQR